MAWHVGEWRSRLLLYKTGTGTLEVKGRNRKGEDHRCKCRTRERETVQHFLAVPKIQKVERRTHSSGEENNWKGRMGKKKLEEDNSVICMVLGLYGGRDETKRNVKAMKKMSRMKLGGQYKNRKLIKQY